MPEMMDEGIDGNHRPISLADGSPAKVIVLKVSNTELLVQEADVVEHLAADEEAKAHQSVGINLLAGMFLRPVPGKAIDRLDIVVVDGNLLGTADAVRARPNQTYARICLEWCQKSPQQAGGHDGVVIEEKDVLARSGQHPLIGGRRKSQILRIGDQLDVRAV